MLCWRRCAQLDYFREITKRMPGAVLRKRGILDFSDGAYSIPGIEEISAAERHELISLCATSAWVNLALIRPSVRAG